MAFIEATCNELLSSSINLHFISMPWLQLAIDIHPNEAPYIEALLEETGALSVSLTDAADEPIYEPPLETSPLWSRTRIIGLFETSTDLLTVVAYIASELGREPAWQIQSVADQDWVRAWLDDFHPLSCGSRLWICPHGYPSPHPDALVLWLDPGLAFGTGTHPTTALCLEWLDASLQPGTMVVDYGCGSGILGLAALRLGAVRCWAIDHDPQALRATIANAAKNDILTNSPSVEGLNAPLWVGLPTHLPSIKADLLLANILARPLMDLAPHFVTLLQPTGFLVLSGILAHQELEVVQAYQSWFKFQPTITRDGWICLVGQKINELHSI